MLQGTLDAFSLDEVLGLLSGANKTGVLNITGDRGVGSVSIADGHLVAGSASSAPGAAELPDVVFELLRYEEGSFSFDGTATAEGEPHELEAIMTEAHSRLDEWKGIEAVVPSLDHYVSLSATLSTSQVTLSESEWAAVVAVGEGASAGVIARRLGLGEFDGSKRIKSLIERSLASIEEQVQSLTRTAAPEAPIVEVDDTPVVTATMFETPEPAPASFADVAIPVVDAPVETEVAEHAAAEIAADFSVETIAPEAPAFEDSAVHSFVADDDIPPMPEAPGFASFDDGALDDGALDHGVHDHGVHDAEVPPMPEPPSTFAESAGDSVPPQPVPPFASDVFDAPPAPDVSPSSPSGLDSIARQSMFEPPRRAENRSTDVFGGDGFDASALIVENDMEAPMPPPPGAPVEQSADGSPAAGDSLPSFAPPAGFDADAFPVDGDLPVSSDLPVSRDEVAEPAGEDASDEKGGSLLMRYLKSHG